MSSNIRIKINQEVNSGPVGDSRMREPSTPLCLFFFLVSGSYQNFATPTNKYSGPREGGKTSQILWTLQQPPGRAQTVVDQGKENKHCNGQNASGVSEILTPQPCDTFQEKLHQRLNPQTQDKDLHKHTHSFKRAALPPRYISAVHSSLRDSASFSCLHLA